MIRLEQIYTEWKIYDDGIATISKQPAIELGVYCKTSIEEYNTTLETKRHTLYSPEDFMPIYLVKKT